MSEFFSSQEDELIILFDKLTKTISTFTTLSRELAEKAIIETNSKIKEGEEMIKKLENFVKNNESNLNKEDMIELNKKINIYKSEFKNLVNKFNQTQSTYINKKAENALIEDIEVSINNKKTDLIEEDISKKGEENNHNFGESNFNIQKRDSIINNVNNMVFEKNIGNISGVNAGNNNLAEEVFSTINIKSNKKRKKIFCAVLVILSVVIIAVVIYLIFFLPKNENNSM
jgi:hypothetical protein